MPRKKVVRGHRTIRDSAFEAVGNPYPKNSTADVLKTRVVLHFGLAKSGLSIGEFSRRYLETSSAAAGDSERGNLIYKWLRRDTAASRKKLTKAGRDISGLLELYDWPGFELLEDKPIDQKRIDEIVAPYSEVRGGFFCWCMPGPIESSDTKSPTWIPALLRDNTERLIHWRNLIGFTILLALVRESENGERAREHIARISDLYRALPTVAAMPGFCECHDLLFHCVEQIHIRCPLSRQLMEIHWEDISFLASQEGQDKMQDAYGSETLWRLLKDDGLDVLHLKKITPQKLRINPLYPKDSRDLFTRVFTLKGKKARTIRSAAIVLRKLTFVHETG
jgi:hypothetical protein